MTHLRQVPFMPNEHLYSRIARYHRLSANLNPHNTRSILGIPLGTFKAQDIFNETFELTIAAVMQQGDDALSQLLSEHSLFGYYRLATPKALIASRLAQWSAGRSTSEIQKYAQNDRIVVLDKAWQSCPDCVASDIKQFGTAYWHTEHQIPALAFCSTHRRTLWSGCEACGTVYSTLNDLPLPSPPCTCLEAITVTAAPTAFQNWLLSNVPKLLHSEKSHLEATIADLRSALNIPMKQTPRSVAKINKLLQSVEYSVGAATLARTFLYYRSGDTQFRGSPRPNFIKAVFYGSSSRVRHPIYYLLLMFAAASFSESSLCEKSA
jgi:hypothetical protein